jgi:hypothetical protein
MDTEDKLFIKDLTVKTRKGYLCVRVMRKWIYNGNIPGGPVLYIGLVLARNIYKCLRTIHKPSYIPLTSHSIPFIISRTLVL